jgi:hypothetical protein
LFGACDEDDPARVRISPATRAGAMTWARVFAWVRFFLLVLFFSFVTLVGNRMVSVPSWQFSNEAV